MDNSEGATEKPERRVIMPTEGVSLTEDQVAAALAANRAPAPTDPHEQTFAIVRAEMQLMRAALDSVLDRIDHLETRFGIR